MLIEKYNRPKYYIYNDIYRKLKYSPSNIKKTHEGQLKLLFSEIQFFNVIHLSDLIDNIGNNNIHILYIGSGRGYHIPTLLGLYPSNTLKWHFYDPSGHCSGLEKYSQSLDINKTIFDGNEAVKFSKLLHKNDILLFISDIRTTTEGYSEPRTVNLLHDYNIQNTIIDILTPQYSLLKFRYPFPDDLPPDFELNTYITGIKYLQCFQPAHSTELRLLINNNNIIFEKFSKKDAIEHEQKLYYYNTTQRNTNDLNIAGYILKETQMFNNRSLKSVLKEFRSNISNEIKLDIL